MVPARLTAIFYWSRRGWYRLGAILLGLLFTLLVSTSGATAKLPQRPEILWDTYGVPHVYSQDASGLFRAFGFAQMQSHANLILQLYGEARGRAAEYWGDESLESDRWVQTMGVPERARQWYQAQPRQFRRYLDAFAAGINTYAQQHPEQIQDEMKAVLPVRGVDVLAHAQRVLHFTFVVDPDQVARLSPTKEEPVGSNGWAIAPSHSESGHALLLANPHLPWSGLYRWYEAHLVGPGIDAYGATLVGLPVLGIAFNDHLGWTHTVNTYDGWDAYQLKLASGGYLFDGKVRPFETERKILKVKQPEGGWREEVLQIRRSVQGPVVSQESEQAIALRVAGLDRGGLLQQWWEMARAKNLKQFESALQRMQIPMFTVLYADQDGHILHFFNGQVPVRSQGDFDDWSSLIPGDTSTTLWTQTHPYEDLPKVLDPASGWLQNANDPPWTTTFPTAINASDYPAYMAPRGPMSFRAQRSAEMLLADDKLSFEEVIQDKHSSVTALANRLLDDLIPIAEQGSEVAQKAAQVLARWNRQTDASGRGAVLFATWIKEANIDSLFAKPWQANAPFSTPDGLANPKAAIAALETAAQKVASTYGALDISWGEVYRIQAEGVDLPANGGPDRLGVFRSLWFTDAEENRFTTIGGDSYVAVVEFAQPVRAKALLTYGNSTQPNHASANQTQIKLAAQGELRSVWRSRPEIEAHLVSRDQL